MKHVEAAMDTAEGADVIKEGPIESIKIDASQPQPLSKFLSQSQLQDLSALS